MAMNSNRSMNRDLQQGLKDGTFKSLAPDRGGDVEMTTIHTRANLLQAQYDINDLSMGVVQSASYN
jgi:hypothetical protein